MNRKALEAARDELLADPDPLFGDDEALGRAYHWLDEPEQARRWLLEAAERYKEVADDPGRVGGILWLAGEDGREWFERARKRQDSAELRYLLGDRAGALKAAERDPDQLEKIRGIAALARDEVTEARTLFADAIRKAQVRPWEDSSGDIGLYGWLEETYRRESELTGKPMPDHAAMFPAKAPLKRRRGIDAPPPPGKRVELDGSTLAVDDDGDITITLPDGRITLAMWGGVYTVTVNDAELPKRYKGFGEAIDAIGDARVRALADASFS